MFKRRKVGPFGSIRRVGRRGSQAPRGVITRKVNAMVAARRRFAGVGGVPRIKTEKKFVDLNDAVYTLNSTPQFTAINLIRVGSGEFNRVGRRINMKYLYIQAVIKGLRTIAAEDECRIMVVYDRQANGSTPVIADIVRSVAQDGTTTSSTTLDHLNLDNTHRFLVLMDHRVKLPSISIAAGVETNIGIQDQGGFYTVKRFIKLRNLETQYKADSAPAVIGDIATGALWFITYANAAAAAEGYQLEGGIRLRYADV